MGVCVTRMVFICPSLSYWAFWRHWIWLQVCCYLQLTGKNFLLSIHNTVCKVVSFGLLVSFLKWELRGMPQSVYPKCAHDVDWANPSSRTGVPQELTALHRKMKNRNAFTYCMVSRALFLKQWDWAERERHVAQVICGTGCMWLKRTYGLPFYTQNRTSVPSVRLGVSRLKNWMFFFIRKIWISFVWGVCYGLTKGVLLKGVCIEDMVPSQWCCRMMIGHAFHIKGLTYWEIHRLNGLLGGGAG